MYSKVFLKWLHVSSNPLKLVSFPTGERTFSIHQLFFFCKIENPCGHICFFLSALKREFHFTGLLVFVALMIYLRTVLSSKTKIPIESAFGYSFILASFACVVAVLTGLTSYSTNFVAPSRLGVPRHHTSTGTVNHSTAAPRPQLPK